MPYPNAARNRELVGVARFGCAEELYRLAYSAAARVIAIMRMEG
jgi:hypothetical protein